MKRQLADRVETYDDIISGTCQCGEAVDKVIGSNCTVNADKTRFHAPGDKTAWGWFRCKGCGEVISDTWSAVSQ